MFYDSSSKKSERYLFNGGGGGENSELFKSTCPVFPVCPICPVFPFSFLNNKAYFCIMLSGLAGEKALIPSPLKKMFFICFK